MALQVENNLLSQIVFHGSVCFTQGTSLRRLRTTLFIHAMNCDTEYVKLCSSNIRSFSIIMYSLFSDSLNKVMMKLIKLRLHTGFTISLFKGRMTFPLLGNPPLSYDINSLESQSHFMALHLLSSSIIAEIWFSGARNTRRKTIIQVFNKSETKTTVNIG